MSIVQPSVGPPPRALRIGVFGGAFDPPHRAHVALARAALAQLALDTLYVIPTGQAWHKARALSDAAHRLAMTRLAFSALPGVAVDARELQRTGPSFTVDTLEGLHADHPHAQLYLVLGADQLAAFQQWHRWQDILRLAIICVASRDAAVPPHAQFEAQFEAFGGDRNRFLTLALPHMAVSATQIRQLLTAGAALPADIAHLVPEPVARYISDHALYRQA